MIICYINYANPTLDDISFLYAFRSEQLQVLKWDEERKKSDFLEMSYNEDIKLISNQAGYIINNAIA